MTTKSQAIATLTAIMHDNNLPDKHRNLAAAILNMIWDKDVDYTQYINTINMLGDQVEMMK